MPFWRLVSRIYSSIEFLSWAEAALFLGAAFLLLGAACLVAFAFHNMRSEGVFFGLIGIAGSAAVCPIIVWLVLRQPSVETTTTLSFNFELTPATLSRVSQGRELPLRMAVAEMTAKAWLISNPPPRAVSPGAIAKDYVAFLFVAFFGEQMFDWQGTHTTVVASGIVESRDSFDSAPNSCSILDEQTLRNALKAAGNVFAGSRELTATGRICMPPGTRFFCEDNRVRFENAFYRLSIALQEPEYVQGAEVGRPLSLVVEANVLARRKGLRAHNNASPQYEAWLAAVVGGFQDIFQWERGL